MSNSDQGVEIVGKPVNPRNKTGRKNKPQTKPRKLRKDNYQHTTQKKLCEVLNYQSKGLSIAETAKITGTSKRTVARLRSEAKSWLAEIEQVQGFKEIKSDLFNAATLKVLKSALSQEKLDAADFKSLAYGLGTIHKMSRLEDGLSTANTQSLSAYIDLEIEGSTA